MDDWVNGQDDKVEWVCFLNYFSVITKKSQSTRRQIYFNDFFPRAIISIYNENVKLPFIKNWIKIKIFIENVRQPSCQLLSLKLTQ